MILIVNELNPTTEFTRILNDVIFDERLTAPEFRLWCQLAAMPRGQKMIDLDKVDDIAAECGLDRDTCRDRRRNLKNKGFLRTEGQKLIVTIPDSDFKPKEVKLDKDQQLRHDLRDAWNKNKPDAYSKQKNPLAEKQVKTLQEHMKHNGQEDAVKFLASVLRGCKAEDWWKEKNLNFNNVFGTGSPKQNKFTNVEKLFKLANSKQGRNALFDIKDDQCWIDWYHAKGHDDMTKVVRLEMERDDAWIHQVDNEGDGTIYIYNEGTRLVHWTYKEGQHGVSYIPTAR